MTDVRLHAYAIDCPDPYALASFYSKLTGLPIEPLGPFTPETVTWLELVADQRPTLAFQRVDHVVPVTWPEGDHPQRTHLDFHVDDLDEGEAWAVSLGATRASVQPGENWRVFLDPIGHPFCLVASA